MNNDELKQKIVDAIASGKLQPTTIVFGDNVQHKIEKVEAGGIGVQINNGKHEEELAEPKEEESAQTEEPLAEEIVETDGMIDQHKELFKEAMLKAQDYKTKGSYRYLLSNTYDWVAAERLGKDIGLLRNYEQLEEILQDKRFRKVPKNSQNLTKYRAYIDSNTRFPNWQCSNPDAEGFFRKFQEIANLINSIYKLACQREHIKPYGSQ